MSSEDRIRLFCSIPLKYPNLAMLMKTVACRKRAPARLLKPTLWRSVLSLVLILGKVAKLSR